MVLLLATSAGTLFLSQTRIHTIRVEVRRTSTCRNPFPAPPPLLRFHASSSGMSFPIESSLSILFLFLNESYENFYSRLMVNGLHDTTIVITGFDLAYELDILYSY